ncbi:DUF1525 domain-containing protein [Vibrio crassostreae]|uniref:DUF1525 domain-containing protein n=1 Tax=Vibrio crassostreae TaxID=246167 RepID=UPI001B30B311|nr:DUF1525 domain-containing protein [Vibrio crassostreae]
MLISTFAIGSDIEPKPIFNAKVFVQVDRAGEIVDIENGSVPFEVEVFVVDHKQKLLDKFNASLPWKELEGMSEKQQEEYLIAYTQPFAKLNTMQIMQSETGYSLAHSFNIKRVPAVVFNEHFIVYGKSLSEAIGFYENWL